jgi:hypothetical protein
MTSTTEWKKDNVMETHFGPGMSVTHEVFVFIKGEWLPARTYQARTVMDVWPKLQRIKKLKAELAEAVEDIGKIKDCELADSIALKAILAHNETVHTNVDGKGSIVFDLQLGEPVDGKENTLTMIKENGKRQTFSVRTVSTDLLLGQNTTW